MCYLTIMINAGVFNFNLTLLIQSNFIWNCETTVKEPFDRRADLSL